MFLASDFGLFGKVDRIVDEIYFIFIWRTPD